MNYEEDEFSEDLITALRNLTASVGVLTQLHLGLSKQVEIMDRRVTAVEGYVFREIVNGEPSADDVERVRRPDQAQDQTDDSHRGSEG